MININLLPVSSLKEKFQGRVFLASYGLFMLIAVAALFSVKVNTLDGYIEALNIEQTSRQNRLATVTQQVADAEKVTKATVREWRQLMAILELEERRRDQTRLLVEVEELLPKSNAWLVTLKHEKGVLALEGISTDKETVSQFLTKLENATYIDRQSVNLMTITQNEVINGIKLTRFTIKANTVFPQPTIVNDGMPDYGLPTREQFLKIVAAAAPGLAQAIKDNATKSGRAL